MERYACRVFPSFVVELVKQEVHTKILEWRLFGKNMGIPDYCFFVWFLWIPLGIVYHSNVLKSDGYLRNWFIVFNVSKHPSGIAVRFNGFIIWRLLMAKVKIMVIEIAIKVLLLINAVICFLDVFNRIKIDDKSFIWVGF